MRVLLLNGENVQVVCMAKALHELGIHVSALCSQKCSSGYASRYLDKKILCPDIALQTERYYAFFEKHICEHQYDIIIPMGDESAAFLSKNKPMIEQKFAIRCAIPDYAIFDVANDKQKLMELCECHNIIHPRTREITENDIQSAADYVGFPAMVKPNISAGAKGIIKVENMTELQEKYPVIAKRYGKCTLQQYVEQPDYYYNVMMYRSQRGDIVGSTVIKIRRYFPLKGGSSCYAETVENPFIMRQCEVVLQKLAWVGFADFDILEDKNSGELKIIEINPRVPSSLQAAFAAGVNFAEIIIKDTLGESLLPRYTYVTGKQVRWLGLDVMWFLLSPQRFSFRPSWFKFLGKNLSYQDGSWEDPMPFVAGCFAGIKKYFNKDFRKAKLSQ